MSCTFQTTTNYIKNCKSNYGPVLHGYMIFDTHWFWFLFIFQNQRTNSSRFFGEKSESKEPLIPVFQNLKESPGFTKELTVLQVVIWPFPNCLRTMVKYFRCHYFGFSFFFFCLKFLWTLWNNLIPTGYLGQFLIPTQHCYGSLFAFRPSGHLHLFVNSVESNKCRTNFQRHAIYGWWPKIL